MKTKKEKKKKEISMAEAVLLVLGWYFIQGIECKKGHESYWNSAEAVFAICKPVYRWRIAFYVAGVIWALLLLFWIYFRFFAEPSTNYFLRDRLHNFAVFINVPSSIICALTFIQKWRSEFYAEEFLEISDLWKPVRRLFVNSGLITGISQRFSGFKNFQSDVETATYVKNNLREYSGSFTIAIDGALTTFAYGIFGAQVARDVRSSKQKRKTLDEIIEKLRAMKTPLTTYRTAGSAIQKAGEEHGVGREMLKRLVEGRDLDLASA